MAFWPVAGARRPGALAWQRRVVIPASAPRAQEQKGAICLWRRREETPHKRRPLNQVTDCAVGPGLRRDQSHDSPLLSSSAG